jgi:hypothetical protein
MADAVYDRVEEAVLQQVLGRVGLDSLLAPALPASSRR